MNYLVALVCVAVASADVSHIPATYLPPAPTASPIVRLSPSLAPHYSAPIVASAIPSISAYSTFHSVPDVSAPRFTAYSSFGSLPNAGPAFSPIHTALPVSSTSYVSAPKSISYAPSTLRLAAPSYGTLLGSNYQIPTAPVYAQPALSVVSTLPEYSGYYSGFDTVYGGVPEFDASISAELQGVRVGTDAIVTEAKSDVIPPKPVLPIAPAAPVTLPSPPPSTTTAAPTSKPVESVESAASYNEIDGYVYKTPNQKLE